MENNLYDLYNEVMSDKYNDVTFKDYISDRLNKVLSLYIRDVDLAAISLMRKKTRYGVFKELSKIENKIE